MLKYKSFSENHGLINGYFSILFYSCTTRLRINRELSHYLIGKAKKLDFASPKFGVQRVDSLEIRQKILKISYSDWKKLGFSKRTLHYMKQNAKSDKPFSLNSHVLRGLGLGKT